MAGEWDGSLAAVPTVASIIITGDSGTTVDCQPLCPALPFAVAPDLGVVFAGSLSQRHLGITRPLMTGVRHAGQ